MVFGGCHIDFLTGFIIRIKQSKPNLSGLTVNKICELKGFTDSEKPTLAGILRSSPYIVEEMITKHMQISRCTQVYHRDKIINIAKSKTTTDNRLNNIILSFKFT